MISVDKAVIARLEKHGMHFEVLVDPHKALELKAGKEVPFDDLLATEEVFTDSHKSEKASEEELSKAFGTSDRRKAAITIIKEGHVQLTTEQRREMLEKKRKEIIDIISRQSINPQTGAPHPPIRIENAMKESRVQIREDLASSAQVETVVEALRKVLPIRIENLQIDVKIPAQYASRAYGRIKTIGKLEREEWRNDGTFSCTLTIPAGMQGEVYSTLNSLASGNAEVKVVKRIQ